MYGFLWNSLLGIYIGLLMLEKYHRQDDLSSRNLFSHNLGGWKSKTNFLPNSICAEGSLPGLQTATFSLYSYTAFPWGVDRLREGRLLDVSSWNNTKKNSVHGRTNEIFSQIFSVVGV